MACLPCLTRTRSWVPMGPFMKISSQMCALMFPCFFFSIFSDRRSLKIENENNNTKTLTTEELGSIEFSFIKAYPGWLELPLTVHNFHGPKPVRATEVLLNKLRFFLFNDNSSLLYRFAKQWRVKY